MLRATHSLAHPGIALIMVFVWSVNAFAAPELRVDRDRFTVDGQPKFLVFVSYFDALRGSPDTINSDFNFLKTNGVDGIRIFPNWWDLRARQQFPADTLMDGGGNLRPDRLTVLKTVLDAATKMGFCVDVSFAYETVQGLSELRPDQVGKSQGELPVNHVHFNDYAHALTAIAEEMRSYRNIFFDIQNEYNGRITHLDDEEVKRVCEAIKSADPKRLVTASLANEIGPEEVSQRSNDVGIDIVSWHESRNPWQYDLMDELVKRARNATTKPIYLGEPAILDDGLTTQNFITAITKAKAGGAAAWTFHTRAGFDLSQRSIVDSMTDAEKEFLRTFKAALDAAPWGVSVKGNAGN